MRKKKPHYVANKKHFAAKPAVHKGGGRPDGQTCKSATASPAPKVRTTPAQGNLSAIASMAKADALGIAFPNDYKP